MTRPRRTRTVERTSRNRFRSFGGSMSFVVAMEILSANPGLDPATVSHEDIGRMVRRLDREGGRVNGQAVRFDLEWIIWDRDGWRHLGHDRHKKAA